MSNAELSFDAIFDPKSLVKGLFENDVVLRYWVTGAAAFAAKLLQPNIVGRVAADTGVKVEPGPNMLRKLLTRGVCAIPIVIDRRTEAARSLFLPAFVLAVCWEETEENDERLPKYLIELQDQVRTWVEGGLPWRLRLYHEWLDERPGAGGPHEHSILDFRALPMQYRSDAVSASASLIAGLVGAVSEESTPPGLFASAEWANGAWRKIGGLEEKIKCGLSLGMTHLFVAREQRDEARAILAASDGGGEVLLGILADDPFQAARQMLFRFPDGMRKPVQYALPSGLGGIAAFDPVVRRLIAASDAQVRILRGPNQSGKSILLLRAKELLETSSPPDLLAYCHFSPRYEGDKPVSASEWLCDLTPRLHRYLDGICDVDDLNRICCEQPDMTAFGNLLGKLGRTRPPRAPAFILLDGLEAVFAPAENGGRTVAEFLDQLLTVARRSVPWLRFVTTAPDGDRRILGLLSADAIPGDPVWVDLSEADSLSCLEAFRVFCLNGLPKPAEAIPASFPIPAVSVAKLEREIERRRLGGLNRMLGNLRLHLVELLHLFSCFSDSGFDASEIGCPSGLANKYAKELEYAFGDGGFAVAERRMAAVLLAAADALPENIVMGLARGNGLNWDHFADAMRGMLTERKSPEGSASWLLASTYLTTFLASPSSGSWFVDASEGHGQLATFGMRAYGKAGAGFVLAPYFQRYLPWHLVASGRLEQAAAMVLDPRFAEPWLCLPWPTADEACWLLSHLGISASAFMDRLARPDDAGAWRDWGEAVRSLGVLALVLPNSGEDGFESCYRLCKLALVQASQAGDWRPGSVWDEVDCLGKFACLRHAMRHGVQMAGQSALGEVREWDTVLTATEARRRALSERNGDAFPWLDLCDLTDALCFLHQGMRGSQDRSGLAELDAKRRECIGRIFKRRVSDSGTILGGILDLEAARLME